MRSIPAARPGAIFPRVSWAAALIALAISPCVAVGAGEEAVVPLPRAHAHNDYEHDRPLEDALARGFCSVEADIFLVDGALLVAHDIEDARPERTLERLYLEPLSRRVRENGGRVHPGGPAFLLLVDIKSEGAATYRALAERLRVHRALIDGGAIRVVVSGNRARGVIAGDVDRLAGIDGRLADLGVETDPALVPLISDRWTDHFRWNGEGEMPESERYKLRSLVAAVHRFGQRIRFWNTADTVAMWRELVAAGVDLINTDDLTGLAAFLRGIDGGSPDAHRGAEPGAGD